MNPVDLLIDLLKENSLTQLKLSEKIGVSPQLVNDIIKYRREITKGVAIKIGNEFGLDYLAFLKPYKLNKSA